MITTTKQQALGKEENLISGNTLLDSNTQFSLKKKKITRHTKKQESMGPFKEKKINRNCF